MSTPDGGLQAALMQLAQDRETVGKIDRREADHWVSVSARLREHADRLTARDDVIREHGEVLTAIDATLTSLMAQDEAAGSGYSPPPAPLWHALDADAYQAAVDRLAAWARGIYQPGYGHLAEKLAPCWASHPLCLSALDIASELWSVLYLQPRRDPRLLQSQAQFQTTVLPFLADQMEQETRGCKSGCRISRRLP